MLVKLETAHKDRFSTLCSHLKTLFLIFAYDALSKNIISEVRVR